MAERFHQRSVYVMKVYWFGSMICQRRVYSFVVYAGITKPVDFITFYKISDQSHRYAIPPMVDKNFSFAMYRPKRQVPMWNKFYFVKRKSVKCGKTYNKGFTSYLLIIYTYLVRST